MSVLPDNERWLLDPNTAGEFQEAVAWAEAHPASGENIEAVLRFLAIPPDHDSTYGKK